MILKRIQKQERGLAFIWTVLALSVIMGMAAYGVDISMWYSRKGAMQSASDASALAGAYAYGHSLQTTDAGKAADALTAVQLFLKLNGYPITAGQTTAAVTPKADGHPNWYRVQLSFNQMNTFASALGKGHQALQVTSTAQFIGKVPAPINGPDFGFGANPLCTVNGKLVYNSHTIPYDYELFGINADHGNGDDEGPLYQNTLNSYNDYRNTKHVGSGGFPGAYPNWPGKDFTIKVAQSYADANSQLQVELWDPDSYNGGGTAGSDSGPSSTQFDEIRSSGSHYQTKETDKPDTSVYQLVWTDDAGTDTVLGTAQYDGGSWWSDGYGLNANPTLYATDATTVYGHMTSSHFSTIAPDGSNPTQAGHGWGWGWVSPQTGYGLKSGTFLLDPSKYVTGGRLHLLVTTSDGSSENGFTVRAGPPHPTDATFGISTVDDCTWNSLYAGSGVQVLSNGTIPLNFNYPGTAKGVALGYVPPTAAGGTFTITRFDTDIGYNGNPPGANYFYLADGDASNTPIYPPVIAAANAPTSPPYPTMEIVQGPWGKNDEEDTDTVYLPPNYVGGRWFMDYTAGQADTSQWHLNATGGEQISLVGEGGQLY